MTDDARRALEWLEAGRLYRAADITATIEAALKQPQLSDEQWEMVAEHGLSMAEDCNCAIDEWGAVATTIRAAREEGR